MRYLKFLLSELDNSTTAITTGGDVSDLTIEELIKIQRETFKHDKQGELIWEEKRN